MDIYILQNSVCGGWGSDTLAYSTLDKAQKAAESSPRNYTGHALDWDHKALSKNLPERWFGQGIFKITRLVVDQ